MVISQNASTMPIRRAEKGRSSSARQRQEDACTWAASGRVESRRMFPMSLFARHPEGSTTDEFVQLESVLTVATEETSARAWTSIADAEGHRSDSGARIRIDFNSVITRGGQLTVPTHFESRLQVQRVAQSRAPPTALVTAAETSSERTTCVFSTSLCDTGLFS